MNHLYEKVSYLRGLCDGLGMDDNTKEGKLLINIIDVLDEFAEAIVTLDESHTELEEYIESVDEDLAELEDEIFEEDDINYIELECPSCGEGVEVDEELLYDEDADILCPNCKEVIIEARDEECCGGSHHHDPNHECKCKE